VNDDESGAKPRLTYLFRVLLQQVGAEIDQRLAEAGFDDIRSGYAKVFPFIPRAGIQVSALAVKAGVRKQTMAQAVDGLERAGYVERRPDPNDGRARLVFLTERGLAAKPVAIAAGAAAERRWAKAASPEAIEVVRSTLLGLLEDPGAGDSRSARDRTTNRRPASRRRGSGARRGE
jgi:DNA-binding MarR family transcriptional regulator